MKTFKPCEHQEDLPLEKLILDNPTLSEETVPVDVLFVGAGPAGLAGAIRLAQKAKKENKDLEIAVLDKAQNLGGHTLSGAVINPIGFKTLFPDLPDSEFPFHQPVKKESVVYLTQNKSFAMPTPPSMKNKNNHIMSLSQGVRWLGKKAEELGIHILTNFPAESLLVREGQVIGVRTTPSGLTRDKEQGAQFLPPTDITASVTVLTEGVRGTLTQAFLKWKNISSPCKQIYALGVKEIWKTSAAPEKIIHTMGWPLKEEQFGGSFLYPMGKDKLALGLVVGLDYKDSKLDVHKLLQQMKTHPFFQKYLKEGEIIEWGAKSIPEGGFYSLPEKLHGEGLLMAGDAVGFVNVPALKGVHYAMMSGIFAADTAFEACEKNNFGSETLSQYDNKVRNSFILKDLKKVKDIRPAFKGGFFMGSFKAALSICTGGLWPSSSNIVADNEEEKVFSENASDNSKYLSKVDAVYLAGNKTRDDIPSHLEVKKDLPQEVMDFYTHLCPAGVYEQEGGKLLVNAPNCVDCKATDVLGPRWNPREGGSGPDYKEM